MRPNKISIFMPSLRGGGAERVIVNLLQGLSEKGSHVDLVLARAEGPYLYQVPKSIRVVDLNKQGVLASLPHLVKYLKKERPKALLSVMDHCNIVALLARMLARVPFKLVVSVHSTLSHAMANEKNLRGKLIPIFVWYFYRFADEIVAVSKGVAQDVSAYAHVKKRKIKIIYNPVITPKLFEMAKRSIKYDFVDSITEKIIIGVGRLNRAKDFETLIKAFRIVKQQCDAKLVILGEGEERAALESLINQLDLKEFVFLPGFNPNPYAIMASASLFVLSSIYEGLPTVLIEALALGIPIVSTDCRSGPREILQHAKTGTLVKVGDVDSMAHAMIKTLKIPIKSNVKPSSLEIYTLAYATNRYLELL
jgi:glycosyltransferase involved in cell wall biosynthesis